MSVYKVSRRGRPATPKHCLQNVTVTRRTFRSEKNIGCSALNTMNEQHTLIRFRKTAHHVSRPSGDKLTNQTLPMSLLSAKISDLVSRIRPFRLERGSESNINRIDHVYPMVKVDGDPALGAGLQSAVRWFRMADRKKIERGVQILPLMTMIYHRFDGFT